MNSLSFAAFAAVILGAARMASIRRFSSTSNTAGAAPSITPDPQDPDDTTSLRIGRINLTQFHPGKCYRRVRICGQPVSESDRCATQAARGPFSSL